MMMMIKYYEEDLIYVCMMCMYVRLMGKVASDKCHKWVFKESPESSSCEAAMSSYWQSSFDAVLLS